MSRVLTPITSWYDVLIRPLEWLGLWRVRRSLWSAMPAGTPGLEIGAGTGANLPFHPHGGVVVITDVSPRALRHVQRKRWASAPPLVVADTRRLPFRSGAFAWAVATLVFCEVAAPVAGLVEVRRVLRANGVLGLVEHVRPRGLAGVLADGLTRLTAPVFGEHFDRDTARNVDLAGFSIGRRRAWLHSGLILLLARVRPAGHAASPESRTA